MKYEIDIEQQDVTTWWLIEDVDYHTDEKPKGEEYLWCHMLDEFEYTEEKHRLYEPEYDEESGKLCSFWLKVEMPKYLWHLDRASMFAVNHDKDNRVDKVYSYSRNIIDEWVEHQRVKHYTENKNFYTKQK
jgi:hypothetical protein